MTGVERRVLKYSVPIDDQPHPIAAGRVLMTHPARDYPDEVARRLEVWVEADVVVGGSTSSVLGSVELADVQVFGTGQPLPHGATWCASNIDPPLVWHIYQVMTPTETVRGH